MREIDFDSQPIDLGSNQKVARNYRFYIQAYDKKGRSGTAFTQKEVDDLKGHGKNIRKIKPQTINGIAYVGFELTSAVEIAQARGHRQVKGLLITD